MLFFHYIQNVDCQIIAEILRSNALIEYSTNIMSCKQTRDWRHDKYKTVIFLTKIVLKGRSSRHQRCYHDMITCTVNKICMVFVHKYPRISDFHGYLCSIISKKNPTSFSMKKICWYCSVSIVICVTLVYDIVYQILKLYLRFVFF